MVNLVGVIIVLSLEIAVLEVGIFHIYPISFRVSLANLLRQNFRFFIEASLGLVISLVREVVSLQEVYHLVILDVVVILCRPKLLVLVQLKCIL